jgi:electron transport complex protein RnfG
MKEILNMMLVLSLICGLAGVSLAALRQATAPIIEEQELTYVQAPAIAAVLLPHDNNPIKDRRAFDVDGGSVTVFPAISGGRVVGVAFETKGKGYGGDIGVMVGFDLAGGALSGIGITTLKETPGLGMRVTEEAFTSQFRGHGVEGVELTAGGGDLSAVAGATISSSGTVSAVRSAIDIFNALKGRLAESWS